jgi:hypothetical protein
MSLFVSRRTLRQLQFRTMARFFLAMGALTVAFGAVLVGRYVLGWW